MVFFSQQMVRIATELALHEPHYEQFVSKFAENTMWIAGSMDRGGEAVKGCGTTRMDSSMTCCAFLTVTQCGSKSGRWLVSCRLRRWPYSKRTS